jgi:hypothetical protein
MDPSTVQPVANHHVHFGTPDRNDGSESPGPLISVFYTGAAIFSFKQPFSYPHEAEWTPFQTNYFSENVVALGIEPEIPGSVARNSDHYTAAVVLYRKFLRVPPDIISLQLCTPKAVGT